MENPNSKFRIGQIVKVQFKNNIFAKNKIFIGKIKDIRFSDLYGKYYYNVIDNKTKDYITDINHHNWPPWEEDLKLANSLRHKLLEEIKNATD